MPIYRTNEFECACFIDDLYPRKETEEQKLEKKCKKLKEKLKEDGYISSGYLCEVMNLECDNPYEFYCGNKETWMKDMVEKLQASPLPAETKQIIAALHDQYKN